MKTFMCGLGFQKYRQAATAFMEKHLKHPADDSDSLLDVQAGHISHTREMEYARSTEDHRQVGREAMHRFIMISMECHKLLLTETAAELESTTEIEVDQWNVART
jgi:hypothetical protein